MKYYYHVCFYINVCFLFRNGDHDPVPNLTLSRDAGATRSVNAHITSFYSKICKS